MARILPAVADRADFMRVRDQPLDAWRPALHALAARHGFPAEPVTRFASGQAPVFSIGGQFVVKFAPGFRAQFVEREAECLRFLDGKTSLPVARLAAEGILEGWHYLVLSRLPGEQLDRVWPRLSLPDRKKLSGDIGVMLRELHRVPVGNLRFDAIAWEQFIEQNAATWTERRDVGRIPSPLREDGPRFLAAVGALGRTGPLALLQGDLAPENVLVEPDVGGWNISGLLDFGNAMIGDPLFDLTAPTVLLAPGQAEFVDRILAGCLGTDAPGTTALRPRLMALTLIHPMADLPECLALVKGTEACRSWDAVAERFWPA